MFDGELAFVDEYGGDRGRGRRQVARRGRSGKARGILLANHGAIVTAPTIGEACYKAETFERMCRFTYDSARGRAREPVEMPAAERAG